jgi:hypothetical protein
MAPLSTVRGLTSPILTALTLMVTVMTDFETIVFIAGGSGVSSLSWPLSSCLRRLRRVVSRSRIRSRASKS